MLKESLKRLYHTGVINFNKVVQFYTEGSITLTELKSIVVLDLEGLRTVTIEHMRQTCRDKIVNRFYSDCLGESKKFDCEVDTDQPKIQGYYFFATLMKQQYPQMADTESNDLKWKESGVLKCYPFTPNQIIKLGEDMKAHITENTDIFEDLRIWALNENRTAEELEGWTWDMQITA